MLNLKRGIEIENIGEEFIVIDVINGRFLELNQVGYIILKQLTSGFSENEISQEISKQFGKDTKESMKMVTSFIDRLKELEILC